MGRNSHNASNINQIGSSNHRYLVLQYKTDEICDDYNEMKRHVRTNWIPFKRSITRCISRAIKPIEQWISQAWVNANETVTMKKSTKQTAPKIWMRNVVKKSDSNRPISTIAKSSALPTSTRRILHSIVIFIRRKEEILICDPTSAKSIPISHANKNEPCISMHVFIRAHREWYQIQLIALSLCVCNTRSKLLSMEHQQPIREI